LTKGLLTTGAVLAILLLAQTVLIANPSQYVRSASFITPQTVLRLVRLYLRDLGQLWFGAAPAIVERVLVVGVLGLAAAGWFAAIRRRVGATEIFAVLSCGVALGFPSYQQLRYLVPFIPLVLFYAAFAITRVRLALARPALACLLLPIAASTAAFYVRAPYGPLSQGLGRPETLELKASLLEFVGDEGFVISVQPRLLALLARTRATIYDETIGDDPQWRYFRSAGVTHVLIENMSAGDSRYLRPFVERHPERFESLWQSRRYALFRVIHRD
jgi:hypothetical protein